MTIRWTIRWAAASTLATLATLARPALAETVAPRVLEEPSIDYPADDGRTVRVSLKLVVDPEGRVETATEESRTPADAPDVFADRARAYAAKLRFAPALKDGVPVSGRIPYTVTFVAPSAPGATGAPGTPPTPTAADTSVAPETGGAFKGSAAGSKATSSNEQDEDWALEMRVQGEGRSAPRGVGDFRVKSELLEAAPHVFGGELLSAAPGFFVDHEESEGVANDVHVRGFDLNHGGGVEFRVGSLPVNIPSHIHGQGYADVNFIIPEVVRSLRVIEGVYDPRQGDFAIAGSAYFDLGVKERGYRLKTSYGSLRQARLLALWAPKDEGDETFAAIAFRRTDGFGPGNRDSASASAMAQYAFDVPANYRMTFTVIAYGARATLPGVIRADDLAAGRIGWFDSYPTIAGQSASGQSASASRTQVGLDIDRVTESGGHFEFTAWVLLTTFRLRENFTGSIETSRLQPTWSGRGDLDETINDETAIGSSARYRPARMNPTKWLSVGVEPGLAVRTGSTEQAQSLLVPPGDRAWDRRVDAHVMATDVAGYFDLDVRFFDRVRLAGGLRIDALYFAIDDRLANATPAGATPTSLAGARRTAFGVAWGPRGSLSVDLTSWLTPSFSYGEGFRSAQARQLADRDATPYSKVRSLEAGLRAHSHDERWVATLAAFQANVANELVFDPESGGLEAQGASTRRGLLASLVARPTAWLLGSFAATWARATFDQPPDHPGANPGGKVSDRVPGVPTLLMRADLAARQPLARIAEHPLIGRIGAGFTWLSGRPLANGEYGSFVWTLNASSGIRYREWEIGVDVFNVFDRRQPDNESVFASNWGTGGALPAPSLVRHFSAAPPRVVVGSLSLHL